MPAADEGCRLGSSCEKQGRCSYVDGACRVAKDEDCGRSEICQECGLCRAAGRRCVARSEADCRASHHCWNFGQCALVEGRCVATSDVDCAACWECKIWGHCVAEGGVCVTDSEGCRRSRQCTTDGRCTSRDGECLAGADEDCKASQICHEDDRCTASVEGDCIRRPRGAVHADGGSDGGGAAGPSTEQLSSEPMNCLILHCPFDGRCTERPGQCVAASDRDCRQGRICREGGKCRANDGQCVAGLPSSSDCRASTECAALGRCQAEGPCCVVGSGEDCRRSAMCREGGRCQARHPGTELGRCVEPEGPDAGRVIVGDGEVPPRGSRVHHCEEPFPKDLGAKARLSSAAQVPARKVGEDILLDPLGLRVRIPSHWYAEGHPEPFIGVGAQALGRIEPRLDEYGHTTAYPLASRLLRSHLAPDALLLFLIPEAFHPLMRPPGSDEPSFVGLTVGVWAVRERVAAVLTELEQALTSYARAASCPGDLEPRYFYYRKDKPKDWIDWDFSLPWEQWRDVESPWKQIGAKASWHAHGHQRSNRVDLRIRRHGDRTIVVMFSSTEQGIGETDLEMLLPVADSGAPADEPSKTDPDSQCILPPKGNIHWAVR